MPVSLPGPGCVAVLQSSSSSALALRFRACSHHSATHGVRDQARKADGAFMRAHARQGASSAACIIFDFNVPFGSFPMPGLAKAVQGRPDIWSPPAHPCPVGGSWPGRFGLPRFYKYRVINLTWLSDWQRLHAARPGMRGARIGQEPRHCQYSTCPRQLTCGCIAASWHPATKAVRFPLAEGGRQEWKAVARVELYLCTCLSS